MIRILVDWDGVCVESEAAKGLGWLTGALRLRDDLPETLFARIQAGDTDAVVEAHDLVRERWDAELTAVRGLAGLSQSETCNGVWQLLLPDYKGAASLADLLELRKSVKDPFLLRFSTRIEPTAKFLEEAYGHLPLGLVTQTTWRDVQNIGQALGVPVHVFTAHECCGDQFYQPMTGAVNKKAIAYAVGLARLNGGPSNTLAVEDSESGIEAATSVGLLCVALRGGHQDLSLAAIEVDDLGRFAEPEIIHHLSGCQTADEALSYLRGFAGGVK